VSIIPTARPSEALTERPSAVAVVVEVNVKAERPSDLEVAAMVIGCVGGTITLLYTLCKVYVKLFKVNEVIAVTV
jgi:hypothetical protein